MSQAPVFKTALQRVSLAPPGLSSWANALDPIQGAKHWPVEPQLLLFRLFIKRFMEFGVINKATQGGKKIPYCFRCLTLIVSAFWTNKYFYNATFVSLFFSNTCCHCPKDNQCIAAVQEPFQTRSVNFTKYLKAALCLQTEGGKWSTCNSVPKR